METALIASSARSFWADKIRLCEKIGRQTIMFATGKISDKDSIQSTQASWRPHEAAKLQVGRLSGRVT
jgi:hypothetical protein